ncbi:MAG: ribose-phosphate diphosphokinase [archaeon]
MEVSGEFERIILLSDHASVPLTKEVYKYLKKKEESGKLYGKLHEFNPDDLYLNRFNNGEAEVALKTEVRGRHIFVVKSFNTIQRRFPYNYKTDEWEERPKLSDCIMDTDKGYIELFTINNALKISSASSITNILMFMPYLRSDKKESSGVPITSKLMADLTDESGASRVITIYPHFQQVQGFYKAQIDILTSRVLFADWLLANYKREEIIPIATDANSAHAVEKLAKDLNVNFGIAHKSRSSPGSVKETRILCDESLEDKIVVIYDDIIDTGGSLFNPAKYAKEQGAREVIACMAHAVLSCDAKERLLENNIRLVTTDSILIPNIENYPNITVLSTGYLLSEAIGCITSGTRVHRHLYDFKRFREVKEGNGC